MCEAETLEGKPIEIEATGLLARALQHEVDHLNGILFIDRMSSVAKASLQSRLKRLQKRNAAWGKAERGRARLRSICKSTVMVLEDERVALRGKIEKFEHRVLRPSIDSRRGFGSRLCRCRGNARLVSRSRTSRRSSGEFLPSGRCNVRCSNPDIRIAVPPRRGNPRGN